MLYYTIARITCCNSLHYDIGSRT